MNFSVVCIAKNEEKTLPRLVKSLEEFQKRGGEIILCDTGSTDKTVEVAKKLGCKVTEVGDRFVKTITNADEINKRFIVEEEPIIKNGDKLFDFSSARNFAATLASNDMIAMPDCDEIYTKLDLDKIEEVIKNGAEQLEYNFVFSHDQYGNEAIKFRHCKFYNRTKLKWANIIHEILVGNAKKVFLDENIIKLEHYQNPKEERGNYLAGLALDCFENQDNDRNSHYFARELLWNNRPKSAIKEFKRHIAMNKWLAERAQSMIFIGDAHRMLSDARKAVEWYHKAFQADASRREALMRLARHYYELGDAQRTACYCSAALEIPWNGFYANQRQHYTNEPHELLYWAEWQLGDKTKSKYHWEQALKYQPLNTKYLYDARYYVRLPKVSIIIPTLGREEKLKRLLKLIKENANYPDYEVSVKEDKFPPNNIGVPKLVKQLTDESKGELVMFLANDVIPQPNFLILAVMKMREAFGEEMDGLVGLNDMYWHGEMATHWLASKKLLPMLGGEFFHTGYCHTGCDNELTERCRKAGKYVWAEEAKVYHDHPVQTGFRPKDMDEVYKLAYRKDRMEHDLKLLRERSKKLGFELRENFTRKQEYPEVLPSYDLRSRIKNPEKLKVLNVGVGDGTSGIAKQLPFIKFKQLDHIDIHKPYLDKASKLKWQSKVNFIHKDIREYDVSDYDLVMMFDVLEHLQKEDALKIIKKVKHGLVFVPIEKGFRENATGVKSQDHLSFWDESDFEGWKTERIKNFHKTFDALWAIK